MGRLADRLGIDVRLVLLVLYSTPLTALLFALLPGGITLLRDPQVDDPVGGMIFVFGMALYFAVIALPVTMPGAAVGWVLGWVACGALRLGGGLRPILAGAAAGLVSALALGFAAGSGLGKAVPVMVVMGGPAALSGAICAGVLWRNKGRVAARGTE